MIVQEYCIPISFDLQYFNFIAILIASNKLHKDLLFFSFFKLLKHYNRNEQYI